MVMEGGQENKHKDISSIYMSHLLTHYWSKEVAWPNPKSGGAEMLSAHSEAGAKRESIKLGSLFNLHRYLLSIELSGS